MLNKSSLIFTNRYSWEGSDEISSAQFEDNAVFNRHRGDEVLFMINKLMHQNNLSDVRAARKIEAMLLSLPNKDKTHRQVKEWVLRNWNKVMELP